MRSIDLTFSATKARFLNAHFSIIQQMHIDLLNSVDDLPLSDAPRLCKSHWAWEPIILSILHGSSSCSLQHVSIDDELISSAVTAAVAAKAKVQKSIYNVLAQKIFEHSFETHSN